MCSGIKPGKPAPQSFHLERSPAKVLVVDRGDLDLASGRRLYVCRDVNDIVVIEIQARHRIVGLRVLRLLLDGDGLPVLVELDNAVGSGVLDVVAEDHAATALTYLLCRIAKDTGEALSVEDVVAKNKCHRITPDEVLSDDKRIGKAPWLVLHGILEVHAKLRPVLQKILEHRQISRGRDDENIPDARKHQRGERIVDHRLVIDRHDLF